MARGLFDVDAHHGLRPRQAARTDVDLVEAFLDHLLEVGADLVGVLRAHGTHQGLLGKLGRNLDAPGDADAHEERRAGVDAAIADHVEDELHDAHVAFGGHQHLGGAGQRAAAAGHVAVNEAAVGVGNDLPVDPGHANARVVARVALVEDLDGVLAKRRLDRGAADGLVKAGAHFRKKREVGTHLDVVLDDARVLTERDIEAAGGGKVVEHRVIHDAGDVGSLLLAKFGKAGGNVVRENLAQHGREARHELGEALGLFLLIHCALLKSLVHVLRNRGCHSKGRGGSHRLKHLQGRRSFRAG